MQDTCEVAKCTICGLRALCAITSMGGWRALQEAVKHTEYDRLRGSQAKGPGLMGSWPAMAMTFVDNHDTGAHDTLRPARCGAPRLICVSFISYATALADLLRNSFFYNSSSTNAEQRRGIIFHPSFGLQAPPRNIGPGLPIMSCWGMPTS